MSKETNTEIEKLHKLSVGRFFCKIFNGQSFVLEVPKDHLDRTTCISEEERKAVLDEQKKRYYVPRERRLLQETSMALVPGGFRSLTMSNQLFKPKY
jgi:hypothetical protein